MALVRLTSAAEADVAEAADWYNAQNTKLAERLLSEFDTVMDRIASNPLQFPIVYRDCRRALLRRFPYAVFFRMIEMDAQVVACIHLRRHPKRWRRRIQSA